MQKDQRRSPCPSLHNRISSGLPQIPMKKRNSFSHTFPPINAVPHHLATPITPPCALRLAPATTRSPPNEEDYGRLKACAGLTVYWSVFGYP